jgi:uncharacterized protein (TIGR04255 family)
MLHNLPEPRDKPLPQAPVQVVVWQLQFAEPADVVPPAVGTTLAERLSADGGDPFQLQRLTAQSFAIAFPGPGGQGAPQAEQSSIEGWTLRRGPVVVTLNRQSMSVETNAYEGWARFQPVIANAIAGLSEAILLPGEQRLGLRYVDRIVRPGVRKMEDWTGLLQPWLTGPLMQPQLRDAVAAYAQQVDFAPEPDGIRATVRQRAFGDTEQRGRQTVILDFDVFREGYRLVETDATIEATDKMHDVARRLFDASISESLYAAFTADPSGA